MKSLLIFSAIILAFSGCGGSVDYDKAAQQTGVAQETLKKLCNGIICHYDDLKDRLEATAIVYDSSFGHSASIQFSWVSGLDYIDVTASNYYLFSGWKFYDRAEIYAGKKLLATLDESTDRIVGDYNTVTQGNTLIEHVMDSLDRDSALEIARAKSITMRFYGKNGYNDLKIEGLEKLKQVLDLSTAN